MLKASYTIEAAIWVPILLGALIWGIRIGILYYQEISQMRTLPLIQELNLREEFYQYQIFEEIIGEFADD